MLLKGKQALAYTAGIIDGEGCICLDKHGKHGIELKVSVGNTKEWLLQWLKMQYGGNIGSLS